MECIAGIRNWLLSKPAQKRVYYPNNGYPPASENGSKQPAREIQELKPPLKDMRTRTTQQTASISDEKRIKSIIKKPLPQNLQSSVKLEINRNCHIVCVGLSSSGITSTIATLLDLPKPPAKLPDSPLPKQIVKSSHSIGIGVTFNIWDVPGFSQDPASRNQNAQFAIGINSFFQALLPSKTIHACLIVCRIDHDIQGGSSPFLGMLTALSHCLRYSLSSRDLSNVVLVLTNSSKVKPEKAVVISSKFQSTFHKIFPPTNDVLIPCVLVDNLHLQGESRRRLLAAINEIFLKREDTKLWGGLMKRLSPLETNGTQSFESYPLAK